MGFGLDLCLVVVVVAGFCLVLDGDGDGGGGCDFVEGSLILLLNGFGCVWLGLNGFEFLGLNGSNSNLIFNF